MVKIPKGLKEENLVTFPDTDNFAYWRNGHHGPNLYLVVPNPKNIVDRVRNGSCLAKIIPPRQESVIPSISKTQSKEIPYYGDKDEEHKFNLPKRQTINKKKNINKRRVPNKKKGKPERQSRLSKKTLNDEPEDLYDYDYGYDYDDYYDYDYHDDYQCSCCYWHPDANHYNSNNRNDSYDHRATWDIFWDYTY